MYCSKSVDSPQAGPHRRLREIVEKHILKQDRYQKPFQAHNTAAFELFKSALARIPHKGLILDSCCGTAMSTRKIALSNPELLVIGLDQSAKRLTKTSLNVSLDPPNLQLVRANCEDFWRLCAKENIHFDKHYILYPNPYPKPEHLKRRWHAHPVFPSLAKISNEIELRSNWYTYLEEFQYAWSLHSGNLATLEEFKAVDAMTLFERKYAESGQSLYKLEATA